MASGSVVPSGETTIRLLEREARVAAFEALADPARSGGGRFVVIEGSAARLLAEARAIADAGMRVLSRPRRRVCVRDRPGSCSSRCSRPPLRISARSCSQDGPRTQPLFGTSQLAASQEAPAEGSFALLHGLYWHAANVAGARRSRAAESGSEASANSSTASWMSSTSRRCRRPFRLEARASGSFSPQRERRAAARVRGSGRTRSRCRAGPPVHVPDLESRERSSRNRHARAP